MGSNPTSIIQFFFFFFIKNLKKNSTEQSDLFVTFLQHPDSQGERVFNVRGHSQGRPVQATREIRTQSRPTPGLYIGGSPSGTCTTRVQAQGGRGPLCLATLQTQRVRGTLSLENFVINSELENFHHHVATPEV